MVMWECPRCGNRKDVVCPVCGADKRAGQDCPSCGAQFSHTTCPKCGFEEKVDY
jgi:ribosomal protein L32